MVFISQTSSKFLLFVVGKRKTITTYVQKGITTLRIYQYFKFYHTVIETCFEILKSSEIKMLFKL